MQARAACRANRAQQFGPLPLGKPHVGLRQPVENVADDVGPQRLRFAADQSIAQADQIVADVDRHGYAEPPMERRLAVAKRVVVFDVVVNERGLVECLDRQGGPLDRVGQLWKMPMAARSAPWPPVIAS